jgi:FkbM family methyltransferase
VIWIEPNPEVFAELVRNISGLQNQRAFQALITDVDGREYQFHIASNQGLSSSILGLKRHIEFWPHISYTGAVPIKSATLASLFKREGVVFGEYQGLVLDTQGAELLVLEGSIPILGMFTYIKVEVADFEAYEGCCQLPHINTFMARHGYKEFARTKIASRATGGNYYDIVYRKREASNSRLIRE